MHVTVNRASVSTLYPLYRDIWGICHPMFVVQRINLLIGPSESASAQEGYVYVTRLAIEN